MYNKKKICSLQASVSKILYIYNLILHLYSDSFCSYIYILTPSVQFLHLYSDSFCSYIYILTAVPTFIFWHLLFLHLYSDSCSYIYILTASVPTFIFGQLLFLESEPTFSILWHFDTWKFSEILYVLNLNNVWSKRNLMWTCEDV